MRDGSPLRAWPLGLVGMLALVAGVERRVGRHADVKFTTTVTSAWTRTAVGLKDAVPCRVVCFGDSLVKFGVSPAVLERRLGLPAYNLAVPKGQAPGHYFQLRRLLADGAEPAALVVDGELLGDDPRVQTRLWPELLNASECAELAWAARDENLFASTALARVLPTFRARLDVRRAVVAAFQGKLPDEVMPIPILWRNWKRNRGGMLLAETTERPDPRPAKLEAEGYRPASWACHPLNAAFVDRFLALAGSRNVPVFWLIPPVHPEVQARRSRYGYEAASEAYLRALAARHKNLVVVDGRASGYPADALADLTHLNRKGALTFSDGLAALIDDRLKHPGAASAWVDLPRWRAGVAEKVASAVEAEDLEDSREAVKRLYAARDRAAADRAVR